MRRQERAIHDSTFSGEILLMELAIFAGYLSFKEGDFELDIHMIDSVDWDEIEDALAEVFD